MAITPQAGYEIDPNNPNSVRKIGSTAMPGSIASINQQQPNIAFGAVNTQPITVSALSSNAQPVTTPVPKPDTTNYMAILDSAKNQALAIQKSIQTQQAEQQKATETKATEQAPAWYDKILSQLQLPSAPSSVSDAYATEYANAGIDAKAQAVTQAQQELDLLNADLQGIVDKATGKNLALENQGGAITAGGVQASSQANIREAAIQALPLQSLILAKSAVLTGNQANLRAAQQKLDTVFKLKSEDADRQYKQKIDTFNILYQVATDAQKNALEEKRYQNEQAYKNQTNNISLGQDWARIAGDSGQFDLAAQITNLNPNSPTFSSELASLQSKIAPSITSLGGSSVGGGSGSTGLSPISKSVISNPSLFYNFTPTQKGQIISELQANGYDISGLQNAKLSSGQQDEVAQMTTVSGLINQVLEYNSDGSLDGIGAFGLGSLKSIGAQVGLGTDEGQAVRALIGNIKGTIAKLRGGTSFTPNEEKLLDSYTPSVNDSSAVAVNKLHLLQDFIAQKNADLLKTANTNITTGQIQKTGTTSNSITDIKSQYNLTY